MDWTSLVIFGAGSGSRCPDSRDQAIRAPRAHRLEHWGVHGTADVGEIVFALVDAGILITQEGDSPEDFHVCSTSNEAFDRNYPWGAGG